MSDEEYVDTIMNIDILLIEMESALQTNNHVTAKRKLQQARSIIADMQEYDEGDAGYNIVTQGNVTTRFQ